MSTIPLLMRLADDLGSMTNMYDGNFGYEGLFPNRRYLHHHHHAPALALSVPQRHWWHRHKPQTELAVAHVGKDGFQVSLDVQQFKPNELTVKTVDNYVVVEAKHEEREDEHGFISRQFVRRYALPKDYDPNQVLSTLSSDGVLTIKAPPPKEGDSNERIVHIQQTGPAHLSVKETSAAAESQANGDKE